MKRTNSLVARARAASHAEDQRVRRSSLRELRALLARLNLRYDPGELRWNGVWARYAREGVVFAANARESDVRCAACNLTLTVRDDPDVILRAIGAHFTAYH